VDMALATLHFYVGDLGRARDALPRDATSSHQNLAPAILAAMLDGYEGNLRSAYAEALALRNSALLTTDRGAFVGASYVAVISTLFSGRFPQTEEVISSALGLAPVTLFARPVFGALLNISAGLARVTRRESPVAQSLALDVPNYAPYGGPLYGMGADLSPHAVMAGGDRRSFDRQIAAGVRLRRSRGYLTAAWTAAMGAAAIDAGDEVYAEIEAMAAANTLPLFSRSAGVTTALLHGRVDELRSLVLSGEVDQDAQLVAQIVRAGQRRAVTESRAEVADALEPLARQLEDLSGYPIAAMVERFESGERLSPREREIALLAGAMTNAQIAHRLNISVRTVEHHISNGLHKIGGQSRGELAAAASEDDA
jgi:DNA-binding CsgD family transcriptional regulator